MVGDVDIHLDRAITAMEGELEMLRGLRRMALGPPPGPRPYAGSYRLEILALLREHPGLSPMEVKQRLGLKVSDDCVHATMGRMARSGQISRTAHATYRAP